MNVRAQTAQARPAGATGTRGGCLRVLYRQPGPERTPSTRRPLDFPRGNERERRPANPTPRRVVGRQRRRRRRPRRRRVGAGRVAAVHREAPRVAAGLAARRTKYLLRAPFQRRPRDGRDLHISHSVGPRLRRLGRPRAEAASRQRPPPRVAREGVVVERRHVLQLEARARRGGVAAPALGLVARERDAHDGRDLFRTVEVVR